MKVAKKEISEKVITFRKASKFFFGSYGLEFNDVFYETLLGVIYITPPIDTVKIGHAHNKREFVESIYNHLKNLHNE